MKSNKTKSHRNHNHTVKKTKSTGTPSIALLVFLGFVIVILSVLVFGKNDLSTLLLMVKPDAPDETGTTQDSTPTPKPSPRPLTKGKETFSYTPGPKAVGPRISEFSLDPIDSKPGQKQTITIKANYTNPVTSVTARLDTDTKKTDLIFTRVAGTDSDGTWQTTITLDDTHDYTYYIDFILTSTPDSYKGGFAFR